MQTIKTSRLTLRIFDPSDITAVYRIMQQPEVGGICATIGKNPSRAIAQAWIDKAIREYQTEEAFIYAILLEGQVVGSIGLHLELPQKTTAKIGYWLDTAAWGKGLALEACTAIIEDLLPTRQTIQKLIATTDKANNRSGSLLLKLGFKLTGETMVNTIEGVERPSFLYEKPLQYSVSTI